MLRSFIELVLSSLGSQIIGLIVLAVVARHVGAAVLGAYGWANNVIPYLTLPLVGVTVAAQREISKREGESPRIAGSTLPTLGLYSLLVTGAVFVLAPLVAPTPVAAHMLRILSLTIGVGLLTTDWWLAGLGDFRWLSVARFLGQVAYGGSTFVLLGKGVVGGYGYAWMNVIGLVVVLVLVTVGCVRRAGRPQIQTTFRRAVAKLREGAHITASLLFIRIYYTADFVLLGFLASSAAVGDYVVAYKLPLALLGFAALWNQVVFTHASAMEPGKLRVQMGTWLTATLVLVAPVCIGAAWIARPLLLAFFGHGYPHAPLYFQILMASVALDLINGVFSPALLATGAERFVSRSTLLGAVVNVGLNLVLIPTLGPAGSATATVAAELGVLILLWRYMAVTIDHPAIAWSRVLKAGLATALMVGVLAVIPSNAGLIVRILAAAASFGAAGLAIGVVKASDKARIMGEETTA